jgi:hypothetical protein
MVTSNAIGGLATTTTLTFNFDKGVWVIKAGQTADVMFQVKLNRLANISPAYPQGQTIFASTTDADNMTAEGVKTLTTSQTSGSAQGKTHTIRTSGLILAKNSKSGSVTVDPNIAALNKGNFTVKFDVTAFDNDVYVPQGTMQGGLFNNNLAGVNYVIYDSNGNAIASTTATSTSASLTSSGDVDTVNNYFVIRQGETKTLTLSVTYDPLVAGYYSVGVYGVNFNTTNAVGATTQQLALPTADYKTDPLNI